MFFYLVLDLVNELLELVFFQRDAFLLEKFRDLVAGILFQELREVRLPHRRLRRRERKELHAMVS